MVRVGACFRESGIYGRKSGSGKHRGKSTLDSCFIRVSALRK